MDQNRENVPDPRVARHGSIGVMRGGGFGIGGLAFKEQRWLLCVLFMTWKSNFYVGMCCLFTGDGGVRSFITVFFFSFVFL